MVLSKRLLRVHAACFLFAATACAAPDTDPSSNDPADDQPGDPADPGSAEPAVDQPLPAHTPQLTCVFEPPDAGDGWRLVSGLGSDSEHGIAATDTALYAFTPAARGLHKSTNDGDSWSPIDNLPLDGVMAIAGSHDQLFVAGSAGGSSTIIRSADGGVTWLPAGDGLVNASYSELVTLREKAGRITVGGKVWSEQESAFVQPAIAPQSSPFLRIAVDDDAQLLYGVVFGGALVGRSTDGGATWDGVYGMDGVFLVDLVLEGELAAGVDMDGRVYSSTDGGVTWQSDVLDASFGTAREVFLRDGALYLNTTQGIVVSIDGANSFTLAEAITGPGSTLVWPVSHFTSRGNTLVFAARDFYYADGQTGDFSAGPALLDATPFSIQVVRDKLFVSTTAPDVQVSADGVDFTPFPIEEGATFVDAAEDESDAYLLGQVGYPDSQTFFPDGGFVHTSSGATFDVIARPPQHHLATFDALTVHHGSLFTGSHEAIITVVLPDGTLGEGPDILPGSYGIWKTADQGASWTDVTSGLPEIGQNDQDNGRPMYPPIADFASVGDALFVAGEYWGVFRTLDDGATWVDVSEGIFGKIDRLAVVEGELFATSRESGNLFRLVGDGFQLVEVEGLPPSFRFASLVGAGQLLFGAIAHSETDEVGVFVSADAGVTWANAHLPFATRELRLFGDELYAGTVEAHLHALQLHPCGAPR